MESRELIRILCDSTSQVLETMFFACVVSDGEASSAPAEGATASQVDFEGALSGAVSVTVDSECGRALTSAFSGFEDQETSPESVEQMLAELTNMICGSVVSALAPSGCFNLSGPQILPPGWVKTPTVARSFDLGDGTATVALRLDA
jgi:CheY-specific phosphatase CheX